MHISGSENFKAQTEKALKLLEANDQNFQKYMNHIASITEVSDTQVAPGDIGKVEIDSSGQITVNTSSAFWPGVDSDLQTKIYATYIAHEAIHAYLISCGSIDWKNGKGEQAAIDYQKCIANSLGVPLVYVENPASTIPGAKAKIPAWGIAALIGGTALLLLSGKR